MTRTHDGRRQMVAASNGAALALGLRPGMPLAGAQAAVPRLEVAEADPEADVAALRDLAAWALRYAPLTAPDPPDGILLDLTGAAHLHGGEAATLRDLTARLGRAGFAARAAVADTPGAAWAVARHAAEPVMVVPPGGMAGALSLLPVAALRLLPETVAALHRVGLDLVGQLASLPRAPLVRRFGAGTLQRLDQALGREPEPITPVLPPEAVAPYLALVEPLLTAEALRIAIDHLAGEAATVLGDRGIGARRVELLFERVDDEVAVIRLGLARPTRDARHLTRLLAARLEEVDPGLGVAAMRLVVILAEPLIPSQAVALGSGVADADLAPLVDRLATRFGTACVFRVVPVASAVPERSLRRAPPLDEVTGAWPADLPRPVRLLAPPQPVEALAALPDHPPAAFTWRGVRRRVRRADGPERVHGEWWRRDGERRGARDYWAVEDEAGGRYWLYRRGDGERGDTGDLAWFLHGLF